VAGPLTRAPAVRRPPLPRPRVRAAAAGLAARVRGMDRILLVFLAIAAVECVAWASVIPPLQGPDEISHFDYTQRLVEQRTIPWSIGADPTHPGQPDSTEVQAAAETAEIVPQWGNPSARPPGTAIDERLWAQRERQLPGSDRSDGGFTSAMNNPPLYYLYEAIPYLVTYPASIFTREFAMRLFNIPALLAVVLFTWLIAGELFRRRRWLAVVATGAVALQPQLVHLAAVVNPDIFLAAIWSAALYVMLLVVRHGATRGRLLALCALAVASALTHGRGVALVVPVVLVLGRELWIRRAAAGRAVWPLGAAGVAAIPLGFYVLARYATLSQLGGGRAREFASYLWQFYLPRLSSMTPAPRADWRVGDVYIDRFYSGFAGLEVNFSASMNHVLSHLAQGAAILAVVGIVVAWRDVRRALWVPIVLGVSAAAYLLFLHAAAFRNLLQNTDPIITGRYLLPLVVLYGLGVALAVSWLPRRVSAYAAGVVLSALVLLQLGAMGILLERFYA